MEPEEIEDNPSLAEGLKKQTDLSQLKVLVEQVADLKETYPGLLGGQPTQIAFKNESSYAVGTYDKGLIIIQDGEEVLRSELNAPDNQILEIQYCQVLDCYFLNIKCRLFKKDINEEPPYPFLGLWCPFEYSKSIRISNKNKRMLVKAGGKKLAVVNLLRNQVEAYISPGTILKCFEIFGKNENRLLYLRGSRSIALYNLNLKQIKVISKCSYRCGGGRESCTFIAVDPKNHFVCVELGILAPNVCSRVMLFKIGPNSLAVMGSIYPFHEGHNIGWKSAFTGVGQINREIVFLGLSMADEDKLVQVYRYGSKPDADKLQFEEVEGCRVSHQEMDPTSFQKVGDYFYYTGYHAKIMRVKIGFE